MRPVLRVTFRFLFYMGIPVISMLVYALLAVVLQHMASVFGVRLPFIWAMAMAVTSIVIPFALWCAVEIHRAPVCIEYGGRRRSACADVTAPDGGER